MITAGLLCLAMTVYFEARGEPVKGQYLVADVVVNRVLDPDFPSTICEVTSEPGQFPWWGRNPDTGSEEWADSLEVASAVLGHHHEPGTNALYFSRPGDLSRAHRVVARVGNHEFLR